TEKMLEELGKKGVLVQTLSDLANKWITQQTFINKLKQIIPNNDEQIEEILNYTKDKDCQCPVCRVYGTSRENKNKSKSSVFIRCKGSKIPGIEGEMQEVKEYQFAYSQVNVQAREDFLTVEPIKLKEKQQLSFYFPEYNEFNIALVCLTADLISSGQFRLGRLTTRGYGLFRLIPDDMAKITEETIEKIENQSDKDKVKNLLNQYLTKESLTQKLIDLGIEPNQITTILDHVSGGSGYELAEYITKKNPFSIILEELEKAK
ncbi:MAG: hypothetical protein ABRQ39_32025, partial [Candidatus Eremiobacterota bacterium]